MIDGTKLVDAAADQVADVLVHGTSAYTPGPWFVTGSGGIRYIEARIGSSLLQEIASCMACEKGDMEANAARIVACVNFCEGTDTANLEQGSLKLMQSSCESHYRFSQDARERLEFANLAAQTIAKQRDELEAALREIIELRDGHCPVDRATDPVSDVASAALAKVQP